VTGLLLVDDDLSLSRVTRTALEKEGYAVRHAAGPEEAMVELRRELPALILLDVRMPGMSGFDLCRRIRETPAWAGIPVVFLTSKDQEADKILGLELGGDDYMTKPFSVGELLARVRAVLRRRKRGEDGPDERLTAGPLSLDTASRLVQVDGATLDLPPKEFGLLKAFLSKKGRVLSRRALMEIVWGQDYVETTRTVDTHVKRLRKNLGPYAACIETVEGAGYRWRDPGAAEK
jgi:DNA-binding response OmpR family regulator